MARTATPLAADRIRIEDEVWEEAFSSRVRSRPRRASQSSAALRPVGAVSTRRPASVSQPAPAGHARSADALQTTTSAPAQPVVAVAARPVAEARRTVRIEGRGAERSLRYTPPRHERIGFSPDRLAMWAVLLGFLLVLVAIVSSYF